VTSEPRLISPTLENLRRAVQAGDTAAVSAFWQTLGNQGTPLIEPIEGDDEHSLVTFIWRAADEDQSVELETNLSGRDATEAMSRLPDTDLWYKTFRAHNETRERLSCLLFDTHRSLVGSLICLSIARGQSGNIKNQIVKILVDGKRFLYTSFRGRDAVSDVILGIKLRGVFFTGE